MPPLPNKPYMSGAFRLPNANNPTGDIYYNNGNQLLNANLEHLGQSMFNPANAPADAIARAAGPSGQFVGGPVTYQHLSSSQRQELGMQALQKQGIDYNSIPVQDYNPADLSQYFGKNRAETSDLSLFKPQTAGLPPAPTGNLASAGSLNLSQNLADPNNVNALVARTKAMLAQTQAQGNAPFAGSSYDNPSAIPPITTTPTVPSSTGSTTAPPVVSGTPTVPSAGGAPTTPTVDTSSTSNTALQDLLKAMTPSAEVSDLYNQNLQIEAQRRQFHDAEVARSRLGENAIATPFITGQENANNAMLDLKQAPIQASLQAAQYQQGLGIQRAQAASDYYNKTFEIPLGGTLAQRQQNGTIAPVISNNPYANPLIATAIQEGRLTAADVSRYGAQAILATLQQDPSFNFITNKAQSAATVAGATSKEQYIANPDGTYSLRAAPGVAGVQSSAPSGSTNFGTQNTGAGGQNGGQSNLGTGSVPSTLPPAKTKAQNDFNVKISDPEGPVNAQNTAIGHLAAAYDLSKLMENWSLQPANAGKNFWNSTVGKAAVDNYNLAHTLSSSELSKAYGNDTGGERSLTAAIGSANTSPEQLRGFAQTSAELLSSKILSNIQSFKTTYGQSAPLNLNWFISQPSQQKLGTLGIQFHQSGNNVGVYKQQPDNSYKQI